MTMRVCVPVWSVAHRARKVPGSARVAHGRQHWRGTGRGPSRRTSVGSWRHRQRGRATRAGRQLGEVLLGHATWALVRDAVEVTALDPLTLKGRSAPMGAWRLEMVKPVASGRVRRLDRPMVGRETERARLRRSAENAARSRSCHLATVVGAAGVGKSRLVAEVLADLEGTASRRRAARPTPARCSPRRPERSTARATSRPPLKPAPGCNKH
jgi:hypothetical protein